MKTFTFFLLSVLFPNIALAACDWSQPQPQADCYPSNPAPGATSGDVGGVPNPGTPSPAPVAIPQRPATLSQLYNQCASDRENNVEALNACMGTLTKFNAALRQCLKKRR